MPSHSLSDAPEPTHAAPARHGDGEGGIACVAARTPGRWRRHG